MSVQDLCHCSADFIQNCMGLVAAIWKASGFGQPPSVPKLGKAFNFDIMADGDAVIGFGNLSCSSQVPIT